MGALVKKGFGKNSTATDQDLLNVWFSKFPTLHDLFLKTLEAVSQEEVRSLLCSDERAEADSLLDPTLSLTPLQEPLS